MLIPAVASFPTDAVQCDDCGGHGCSTCQQRGWLPAGDTKGRLCAREACRKPLAPDHVAVYCSDRCAFLDA